MEKDEKDEAHPSYVMMGFHRIQGCPGPMFGSHLDNHMSFVELHINQATRSHGLSHDTYHAEIRPIVKARMTSAQFAELLTTMNGGVGVPATLCRFGDHDVAPPPRVLTEARRVRDGFRKKLFGSIQVFDEKVKHLADQVLPNVKPVSAREEVRQILFKIHQELHSNMPFILDMFEEAAGKVVASAKAEVDAFVTTNIVHAGLRALGAPVVFEDEPKRLA